MRGAWIEVVFVVAVACVMLGVGLGARGLWDPVEPRYAGIAAEMAREGEWWVPRYNGAPFDQKAPLFFWMTAAALEVVPDRMVAIRLPSMIGGVALVALAVVLGQRVFGGRAGFYAGLALIPSFTLFWSARFCHMDLPMAALFALAMLAVWEAAMRGGAAGAARASRKLWIAIGGAALGGTMLMKGPAAMVFAVLAVAFWAKLARRGGIVRESGVLWMAVIAMVIAASWFVPAWRMCGDEWARELLIGQGLGRLFDDSQPQKHSISYYPVVFFGVAGLFSILIFPALYSARRRRRDARDALGAAFAVAWMFTVVGVLALGATARSRYLLPMLPAFAILVGSFVAIEVAGAAQRAASRRWVATVSGCAALVLAMLAMPLAAPASCSAFAEHLLHDARAGELLQQLAALGAGASALGWLAFATAIAGAALAISGRALAAFHAVWIAGALLLISIGANVLPTIDNMRGDRALIEVIERESQAGRQIAVLGRHGYRESALGFLGFHAEQRVLHLPEGGAELERLGSGAPTVLIVRELCRPTFLEELSGKWWLISDGAIGRHELWIYANRSAIEKEER